MAVGMSSPGPAHTAARAAGEDRGGETAAPDTTGTGHLDALSTGIDPDDLPDGLVVADGSGRVICFNAAAARITATPGAEAIGRPSTWPSRWRTSRGSAGGR
ncbi:hypothetical protein Smic_12330 [Streptomyces microflavus]|uniref:PAS fold domain-containing protein n=1 Tax=Streptomyces microflavus TaxID=1919 RepID=A0A7J0CLW2_STRMI|nr:hypothetical protein Smic_12330 [Streptomyces microflavus]